MKITRLIINNYLKIPIFIMYTLLSFPIIGYCQYDIIVPPNLQEKKSFGRSIAVNKDFLFIGEPRFNYNSDTINEGTVYIYRFDGDTWNLHDQLLPDSLIFTNSNNQLGFGGNISLSENYLVVSNHITGFISIYKKNILEWNKLQDIKIPISDEVDFYTSLEITDSLMIVGVQDYENTNENTGAVLIFENNEDHWTQVDIIYPPEDELVRTFGHQIGFDGSKSIIIGSRKFNEFKGGSFLYTFENENWNLKHIYRDNSEGEQGLVVEMDEDKLAINGEDEEGTYIELYQRDGDDWVFERTFESDIFYLNAATLFILGDFVHFNKDRVFIDLRYKGVVNLYEESDGSYIYKESFPPNIEDDPLFQWYLNGYNLASTDDFLFSSALGYSKDPYDIEEEAIGAVFVFPISKTNHTSDDLKNEKFTLSPNPCSHQLNITSEEENRFSIHSILDVNGKKLNFKPSGESIDVSHLESGVYILTVLDNVSKAIKYSKFIKI